jgi:hypothetical protein
MARSRAWITETKSSRLDYEGWIRKAGSGGWIKVAGMDAELGQHGEVRLIRDACSESWIKRLDQEAGSESLDQGGWIRTLDQAG